MASITIRRLEDTVKAKLQVRAASHGRSMEEEAREILRAGLKAKSLPRPDLAQSIRRYVEPFGGVELALPPREAIRRPPKLVKYTISEIWSRLQKPLPDGLGSDRSHER